MSTNFWLQLSQIERITEEGGATGKKWVKGESFCHQSLIPAEISAEI